MQAAAFEVRAPDHGAHAHAIGRAAAGGPGMVGGRCFRRQALGTIKNCAMFQPGVLPLRELGGTSSIRHVTPTPRNGLSKSGVSLDEFDERFDDGKQRTSEAFGCVVGRSVRSSLDPAKRTALGRFSHEGAWPSMANDGRLTMYMGDDRAFEYIYKFVSRDRMNASDRAANRDLLDHGTLYVAKFHEDGGGEWVALVHGQGKLNAGNGFADQAEVLIKTRQAADALGATRMDRPEWIAVPPRHEGGLLHAHEQREPRDRSSAWTQRANPRSNNVYGHIIRWREDRTTPRRSNSNGTFSCSREIRSIRRRPGAERSRGMHSAVPTDCGSTTADYCGSRPTSRPAPSTKGTTSALATIRCCLPMSAPEKSAVF